MFILDAEAPADAAAREHLLDRAFGQGRHRKTSERLREGRLPATGLSLVVRDMKPNDIDPVPFGSKQSERKGPAQVVVSGANPYRSDGPIRSGNALGGLLVATVRLWHVALGDGRVANGGDGRAALLLGPLAVEPSLQGAGLGSRLMRRAIAEAAFAGHGAIILVGDADYYARFGFTSTAAAELNLPGPVDRHRFLGLELRQEALSGVKGMVRATGAVTWPAHVALQSVAA